MVTMTPMDDERVLFEERLWYPTWPILILLGFLYVVAIGEALVGSTDTTGWIIALAFPPVVAIVVGAVFKWIYRRLVTRVGEQTMELSRDRVVPRESVQEARIVSGDELKRLRHELRRGANLVNANRSARLRGLVTMPGVKTAVYLRVDPPVKGTGEFLIATRRPEELLAAVQGGVAALPATDPAPAPA